MTKYALYYAITREGKKEVIAFGDANEQSALRSQAKKDMFDEKFGKKYQKSIIASHYGIESNYTVPMPKITPKKKASKE